MPDERKTAIDMVRDVKVGIDELLRELAAKDAEIARLKAALKPVLDHDTRQYGHGRSQPSIVVAVREAKRIYNEGGEK